MSISLRRLLIVLLLAATLVLGFVYQLQLTRSLLDYRGFSKLTWAINDRCIERTGNAHTYQHLRRMTTWSDTGTTGQAHCVSDWIEVQGNYLELEFAGVVDPEQSDSVYLTLESREKGIIKHHHLPMFQGHGVWKLFGVLMEPFEDSAIRVHLSDKATGLGWLSLRGKINFYEVPEILIKTQTLFKSRRAKRAVSFALSCCLTLIALILLPGAGYPARIGLIFLSVMLVHFRSDPFFYIDDWQYLERIFEHGLSSILMTQNEHFIPAFSSLFYLQFFLFSKHYALYLLASLFIHSINALLLGSLLKRILAHEKHGNFISQLLAFLYAISGLHSEVLQWLTCQSTIWAMTCRLLCFICAWDFVNKGKRSSLAYALVAALLGPLVFGGNFSVILELAVLAGVACFFSAELEHSMSYDRVAIVRRICLLLGLVFLALLADVGLYSSFREGSGLALEEAKLPVPGMAFRYILLGSQFGTILRGLGLSQAIALEELHGVLRNSLTRSIPLDLRLSLAALMINLGCFFYYCRKIPMRRMRLSYWLFAQVIILMPFLLTVFSRLQFGIRYALSMRYYTVSLLGLVILVAPILCDLAKVIEMQKKNLSVLRRAGINLIVFALLALHIYKSIGISSRHLSSTVAGSRERVFFEQIDDWNKRLGRTPGSTEIPFDGMGSELSGLYPLYYQTAPGIPLTAVASPRHPDRIWQLVTRNR